MFQRLLLSAIGRIRKRGFLCVDKSARLYQQDRKYRPGRWTVNKNLDGSPIDSSDLDAIMHVIENEAKRFTILSVIAQRVFYAIQQDSFEAVRQALHRPDAFVQG